jgi:hypothetical protein
MTKLSTVYWIHLIYGHYESIFLVFIPRKERTKQSKADLISTLDFLTNSRLAALLREIDREIAQSRPRSDGRHSPFLSSFSSSKSPSLPSHLLNRLLPLAWRYSTVCATVRRESSCKSCPRNFVPKSLSPDSLGAGNPSTDYLQHPLRQDRK